MPLLKLLSYVCDLLNQKKYAISNIDATVIAQKPKLKLYIAEMKENLSMACKIGIDRINIKATTEEGLGFTGKSEGISAHAVCLINELE